MQNEANDVSVIIPAYNASRYIKDALDSALNQTYKNIEIIVVDDGSSDSTIQLVQSYGPRVRLLRQENKGAASARNYAAKMSRGYWLAFLDADDSWVKNKIEIQISNISGLNWSYTDTLFVGGVNDGFKDSNFTEKHEGDVLRQLVRGNFISTSTVLIKREIFLRTGGFDEDLRSIQDWELWTRVAEKNPIAYIDQPLTKYRIHPSSTSRKTRLTLPNHLKVIDIIFSRVGSSPEIAKLKPEAKATSCGICSYIAEEEGDASFAVKCAFDACRFEPLNSSRWIRLLKTIIKWTLRQLKL